VSLTLLLDLDDTLLVNDIDTFLPGYLGAFGREVAPYMQPDKFVAALLAGTRQMVKNRNPDCTLQEVFAATFFPSIDMEADKFQGVADKFYAEVFPTLRDLTRPRPEAVRLVEQALARNYRLAIATNPLFPRTAIEQRLRWAGLPVETYPFELVTSYESFHFAKPDIAYFAELMARLGWPEGPVLMVGNDLERDILPAHYLGLPTFQVTAEGAQPGGGSEAPTHSGGLAELLPWLEAAPEEVLQPDYNSSRAMLATLRSTPAALDSMCRQLPADRWRQKLEPGEWCVTEVLCHLRDVDREVNLPRLQKVLQEANPFLPGRDTDPWAEERNYIQQDGPQALHEFSVARLRVVEMLEGIRAEDWQRSARHAIFGPTQLSELVGIIAAHDRLHIRQVREVLGEEV
jgi:FMN phosphatase YigB (HAD superfamily)